MLVLKYVSIEVMQGETDLKKILLLWEEFNLFSMSAKMCINKCSPRMYLSGDLLKKTPNHTLLLHVFKECYSLK